MTRNGKIARLPAALREQINRRLDDGQKSTAILPWLNALPEVKAVIDAEFEGRLITDHNLSEWRTGGYAAWAEGQRLRGSAETFLEDAGPIEAIAGEKLMDAIQTMLGATMADQMQRLLTMPDGAEKRKMWKELRIGFLALRQSEFCALRMEIQKAKHGRGKGASAKRLGMARPSVPVTEKKMSVREMLGIGEGFDGSLHPELTRDPGEVSDQNLGVDRSS